MLAGAVAQRTKEIRCAGGHRRGPGTGRPHDPRWGITAAASGIAIGLVAAVALRPVLEALLFGVSVRDPVTYVVVGATPATVVLLACYVPAVRATKIEPLLALRCD